MRCTPLARVGVLALVVLGSRLAPVAHAQAGVLPGYSVQPHASPEDVRAADLDGDGLVDLLTRNDTSNDVSVLRNVGAGAFVLAASFPAGTQLRSFELGDLDGDGVLDLVVGSKSPTLPSKSVGFLRGDGLGGFSPPTFHGDAFTFALGLGDVNADGALDVVELASLRIVTLFGDGAGGVTSEFHLPIGTAFGTGLAVADFDHDGLADYALLFGAVDDAVQISKSDGTGHYADVFAAAVGKVSQQIRAVDVNGDGHLDVVTANSGSHDVSILVGAGDMTFMPAPSVPALYG